MKSLFMRLKKRKGFTLVECIVAIAVFAAFCLMVMMIVAGAQKESIAAHDTEVELNDQVDSIMGENAPRRYNGDLSSKALNLKLDGDKDLSFTYDIIEGHKNYIVCESCGHFGDNREFMDGVSTEDFKPWEMTYKCPECGNSVAGGSDYLKCRDCSQTGNYTNSGEKYDITNYKAWTYNKDNGSFICNHCGGSNVSYKDIEDYVFEEANVSVSSMVANAIRYGSVKAPDEAGTVTVSGAKSVNVNFSYSVAGASATNSNGVEKNPNNVGTYQITLSLTPDPDIATPDPVVTLSIPRGYYFEDNVVSSGGGDVTWDNPDPTKIGKEKDGKITWKAGTFSNVTLKFKLRNTTTGYSFQYDYQKVKRDPKSSQTGTGLSWYWFGLSSNSGKWPKDAPAPSPGT